MPWNQRGSQVQQTVQELDAEVEGLGGWEMMTSVKVDGKNSDAIGLRMGSKEKKKKQEMTCFVLSQLMVGKST